MYSCDPRPDTGSLMQLKSRRAVDGREVKNHCTLRDHAHFFHFLVFDSKPASCQPICGIIIANESLSSAKASLVCSFSARGKNRRHLGCRNIMRSRVCAVQNKGITLIGVFGLVSARVRGFLADLNCVQEKAHKKMEFTRTYAVYSLPVKFLAMNL